MRSNFIQSIIFGLLKLLLLAALVVLGIVFVPDGLMERIRSEVDGTGVYLSEEAARRAPAVRQDIELQVQETKSEAITLYQLFEEKYFSAVGSWVADLFNSSGR